VKEKVDMIYEFMLDFKHYPPGHPMRFRLAELYLESLIKGEPRNLFISTRAQERGAVNDEH